MLRHEDQDLAVSVGQGQRGFAAGMNGVEQGANTVAVDGGRNDAGKLATRPGDHARHGYCVSPRVGEQGGAHIERIDVRVFLGALEILELSEIPADQFARVADQNRAAGIEEGQGSDAFQRLCQRVEFARDIGQPVFAGKLQGYGVAQLVDNRVN